MSGVKKLIQSQTKGTKVPTNDDYKKVGKTPAKKAK